MKTTSLLAPLLAAGYVSAHGFLNAITINGQAFKGNVPSGNDGPSVIRQVSTQDPNKGANNVALTCGPDSTAGSLIADANPGDALTFDWRTQSLSPWPHNTGPMLTYMASCGSTTCDKFDISKAKWFKIQQDGKTSNDDSVWIQAALMTGGVAKGTIPKTLAPGNYLIRHEIIALHLATSLGGAEFYPGCAQLRVGGTQTGAPKASELVSLPGAYNDNDPGIYDPNVFDPSAPYTFPGPPIAAFVSAGGGSGPGSGTAPAPAPSPTSTKGSSGSGKPKSCKIKKRSVATSANNNEVVVRSRHFSHIMRRLAQSLY